MIVVFFNLGWFPTSGMENVSAFYEGWDKVDILYRWFTDYAIAVLPRSCHPNDASVDVGQYGQDCRGESKVDRETYHVCSCTPQCSLQ